MGARTFTAVIGEGDTDVIAFSPDGRFLASAATKLTGDEEVSLWDRSSNWSRTPIKGHTRSLESIAFSPRGDILVTADREIVRIWTIPGGEFLRGWTGKSHVESLRGWKSRDYIDEIAVTPDGKHVRSVHDGHTRFWELGSGKLLAQSPVGGNLLVAPESGEMLAIYTGYGEVRVMDETGERIVILPVEDNPSHPAASPDHRTIAYAERGGKITIVTLPYYLQGVPEKKEAIAELKDLGFDIEATSSSVGLTGREVSAQMVELVRNNLLNELSHLDLSHSNVSDEELSQLTAPTLQRLILEGTRITNIGLESIGELNQVYYLNIANTDVTAEGFRSLQGLSELFHLRLDGTQIKGIIHLSDIKSFVWIDLSKTQTTDGQLQHLVPLANKLKEVNLSETAISDDGLRHLGLLANLTSLDLDKTPVTDKGLESLLRLNALTSLSLGQTKVTDDGLQQLAGMESLRILQLDDTAITSNGLRHLSSSDRFSFLNLNGTNIDDTGVRHLVALKNQLSYLFLERTSVSDSSHSSLTELDKLEVLRLSESQTTDKLLTHLGDLPALKDLSLGKAHITPRGVQALHRIRHLEEVTLGPSVRDEDLASLGDLPPLYDLSFRDCEITDQALVHLKRIRSVDRLGLWRTQISEKAVDELRAALPFTDIDWRPRHQP